MNLIQDCFKGLQDNNQAAMISYICAGHPSKELTVPAMHALVEAGTDIIELGMPFSDPMADGPVIQKAAEKAIEQGTNLQDVFSMVSEFRRQNSSTPIVLMGYMNPVERYGHAQFIEKAKQTGVNGFLLVDLPIEEGAEFRASCLESGIAPIMLAAPTTDVNRAVKIAEQGKGFLYYVSFKGITGAAALEIEPVKAHLSDIQSKVDLPIGVGFGVKSAEQVKAIAQFADAVVVGSAIVSAIDAIHSVAELKTTIKALVSPLKAATRK